MSAQTIQKKIDAAHKKVGKKLGYEFGVYRPIYNTEVLADENWVKDVFLTATLSDSYTTTLAWAVPVWMIYTEAAVIQEGDFIWSEEQGRTFFVISRLPHLPVMALEVNDRVDIYEVTYTDAVTGFAPGIGEFPVMKNLPVAITQGTKSTGSLLPQADRADSGSRQFEIITTFPDADSLLDKHVTIANSDMVGSIVSYAKSAIGNGVKFVVKEM